MARLAKLIFSCTLNDVDSSGALPMLVMLVVRLTKRERTDGPNRSMSSTERAASSREQNHKALHAFSDLVDRSLLMHSPPTIIERLP